MMQVELGLALVALVLVIASAARLAFEHRRSPLAWWLLAGAAAVFVVRWTIAEPTFVHASLHGPRLLEQPYVNPYESFRGYGPVAPLLHGWVLRGFGPDLTHVALLHQLCASLTLIPLAWVAARLANSRWACVGVFVVAALHPVLVRIGASEDGHVLAVVFAWLGIAGLVAYADERRPAQLVLGTAAVILMIYTRQIMLALLPFAFALALARRRELLRERPFMAAAALCGVLVVLHLVLLGSHPDQAFHLRSLAVRFPTLGIVTAALRHHPLFDVGLYQPMFVPLWLIGMIVVWRDSLFGKCFVACFAAQFVATLWLYEGLNVALMFRMPLLTIGCALAGVGFARVVAGVETRSGVQASRWMALAFGALVLVVPLARPGWRLVTELRPLTHEYRLIQRSAPLLPERAVLVLLAGGGIDRPGYEFPTHVLRGAGVELVEHTSADVVAQGKLDEPLVFLRGDACYAYSLIELSNIPPPIEFASIIATIGEDAANQRVPANLVIPAGMRPECELMLRGAEPIGELVRVPARPFDVPFVVYGVDELELGFYRVTPDAVRAVAELESAR
jgi:hypothetical protein